MTSPSTALPTAAIALSTTPLAHLEFLSYLTEAGEILPEPFEGKVGLYAIFDEAQTLQYVGFSRNVFLSLKQHLTRRPLLCHWVKLQTLDRPNRTLLAQMQADWIAENGATPEGNGEDAAGWEQAIDAKAQITSEEQAAFDAEDEAGRIKVLKNVARRVEAEIKAVLEQRGVTMGLRFDPKLKEQGLLTLK
jgi:hypothetical protein